jgi:hypothetical protein
MNFFGHTQPRSPRRIGEAVQQCVKGYRGLSLPRKADSILEGMT